MTTTRGRNSWARSIACCPSPASATTAISGSSSSMRRNPRRTRPWSSARRTVMLRSGMALRGGDRHGEAHQGAAGLRIIQLQAPIDQLRPFPHRDQSHAGLSRAGETGTVIFHFKHRRSVEIANTDLGAGALRMLRDVVQGLLYHAVEMDGNRWIEFPA